MVKDTKVIFQNNSDMTILIKASGSNEGRFNDIRLEPGQSGSRQDSYGGLGNYDVQWDVIINPGSTVLAGQSTVGSVSSVSDQVTGRMSRSSKYQLTSRFTLGIDKTATLTQPVKGTTWGSFTANNPAIGYPSLMQQGDDLWPALVGSFSTGKTRYFKERSKQLDTNNMKAEGDGITKYVGTVVPGRIDYWTTSSSSRRGKPGSDYYDIYSSPGILDGFDQSLPYAKIDYLGDSTGVKLWNFTFDTF